MFNLRFRHICVLLKCEIQWRLKRNFLNKDKQLSKTSVSLYFDVIDLLDEKSYRKLIVAKQEISYQLEICLRHI